MEIRTDYRPKNTELNSLNRASWEQGYIEQDYSSVLDRSLGHICAFEGDELIGFVNIAWDGGSHAFILDTCVAPPHRRRGLATKMVKEAIRIAKQRGAHWLHVDYEPHLEQFYQACGFRATKAGLVDLSS